jgi:hypothetical protein
LQTAIQHAISMKGLLFLDWEASAELESVPTANHNFYTQPRITPKKHLLELQTLSMKMKGSFVLRTWMSLCSRGSNATRRNT